MPTYSGEIVRQDADVATAFADGAKAMIGLREEAPHKQFAESEARSRALFLMAALSRTVTMVRATGRTGQALADEMRA